MAKITVAGAGSWGTALAILLDKKGHQVTLCSVRGSAAAMLSKTRMHETKLPGVLIPEGIEITGDLESAVKGKELLVLAVPSPYVRETSRRLAPFVEEGLVIVNVSKGIEEASLLTMTDIIKEEIGGAKVAVLSGPSHAEEVGRGLPTTVVVGAEDRETALFIQNIFLSPVFRVYISPDILGIELGGSLKNVIALAAGIADGLGCGDNTKAALITRGIAEIKRLGIAMGAHPETLTGLSGMGDLIVTCASVHSRNRRAGYLMGQGRTMKEAMDEVEMVVEGVYSAKAALRLAKKYKVDMPIVEEINKVLFADKNAKTALNDLMMRDAQNEARDMLSWEG